MLEAVLTRKNIPADFTTFVAGLITEVSPLTFPDNASLSEVNFNLNRDGSRQRRLGFDYEDNFTEITVSGASIETSTSNIYTTYKWSNAGGNPIKAIVAVQVFNRLHFFDTDSIPLSDGLILTYTMPADTATQLYSYAVVDGILVVACGNKNIYVFEYDGLNITASTDNLYIRDLFGVEDIFGALDLNKTSNIELRPTTLSNGHLYNLRNQTFAQTRYKSNIEIVYDPIKHFYEESDQILPAPTQKTYPSNSDSVVEALYPDSADSGNRTVDRFFAEDLITNPIGSIRAPVGYFIIDALERGESRLLEDSKLRVRYPNLSYSVTNLPQDITPGGATVVSQFAGRIWYAGFSGEIVDGDNKSPNMSSYILFSQLVQEKSNIGKCYQQGDPTSRTEPDLLDTDGGFLRIDGAYGIHAMFNLGRDLIITAANGVWRITGGDRNSFTANNYAADKISDQGSINQNSVVRIDNDLMFWGVDGIYLVTMNDFGDRVVENISQTTIQTYFSAISDTSKRGARGFYDSFERKVRWIFDTDPTVVQNTKELVFDVNLRAFYPHEIIGPSTALPRVVSMFETKPFVLSPSSDLVVVSSDQVQVSGVDVVVTVNTKTDIQRELNYMVITNASPFKFTFGYYKNTDFLDYKSYDDSGSDAAAEMITGYLSAGDFQRGKGVTYLTAYLRQTEGGFLADDSGDLYPSPASSCKLQAQWDWSNSSESGRWNSEREIYKLRRPKFPNSVDSNYVYGFNVVVSKNKIRGGGKVLSLRFSSSPGKDLHLYGWSIVLGVENNV